MRGSENIRLRSLRLLPHVCPVIEDPRLSFGETDITVFTSLAADTTLYFNGNECIVKDLYGRELSRPAFVGAPTLQSGKCEIALTAKNGTPDYRARLTVIALGEKLQ